MRILCQSLYIMAKMLIFLVFYQTMLSQINPMYLFAAASGQFAAYKAKRVERETKAFKYMQDVIAGKHTLVQVKHAGECKCSLAVLICLLVLMYIHRIVSLQLCAFVLF